VCEQLRTRFGLKKGGTLGKKHAIKVSLRKIKRPDKADTYYALVEYGGLITIKEICSGVAKRKGNTADAATLKRDVSRVLLRVVGEILDGKIVDMGDYSAELCVRGEFKNGNDVFDITRHKLALKIVPKEALIKKLVRVEVKTKPCEREFAISWMWKEGTNSLNGMFKPGDILMIEGFGLHIEGDQEKIGIYFVGADKQGDRKIDGSCVTVVSPERIKG